METANQIVSIQNNTMGKLDDLGPLAKRLNEKSDNLQVSLRTINEKLAKYGIGIEAWLSDHGILLCAERKKLPPDQLLYRYGWDLGYCKIGEGWCLAVRECWVIDNDAMAEESGFSVGKSGEARPLLSAPRNVRIEALDQLEYLVEQIIQSAKAAIERIKKAEKLAEEL